MTPITAQDRHRAAQRLGVDEDTVQAVLAIEARGSGFIRGRQVSHVPVILFEGHIFWRETDGVYPQSAFNYPKWTKAHYKGGLAEYDRLAAAADLDLEAALKSASWGLGQIMGFNHKVAGYASVIDFVNAMAESEANQLDAFVGFIEGNGLADELRREDMAGFARGYNGKGYKANQYDTKLIRALTKFRAEDPERDRIRDVQATLNYALGLRLTVDGWMGPKTADAIRAFKADVGLPANDDITPGLLSRLGIEDMEAA